MGHYAPVVLGESPQAAKKAASYMDYSAFSRTGLIDQLEFEGFTPSQAEYGAEKAYYA